MCEKKNEKKTHFLKTERFFKEPSKKVYETYIFFNILIFFEGNVKYLEKKLML